MIAFGSILGLQCLLLASRVDATAVFAHFMVQNAFSYDSVADWTADIVAAQAIGIDGFALNTAVDDYEVDRYTDAFAAAEAADFKFFISFDMTYDWASADMVSLVQTYASSSAYYQWNGLPLVSTYDGDNQDNDFWQDFKDALEDAGITISLAPAFVDFRDPSEATGMFETYTSIDGFFNWWSWPEDVAADLTTATDLAYQAGISAAGRTGPYIMAVSPWQFKELGGELDWVEQSDELWKYRWEQAISDVKPDIVEIVTWNDYGESHYISDINPNVDLGDLAPLYVNGFVHAGWRTMAQYYISWYKTGTAPAITEDQVVYWYRAYPKAITCSEGDLPRNSDFPSDSVFAFSMLTSAATITLTVGDSTASFDAPAGIAIGSVPFSTEDAQSPVIEIVRNGATVKSGTGAIAISTTSCAYYNFNPLVGIVE
ncbi:glycoside hydrolase family 71 protein [Gymnopus androsaceus JB14]|uniref:Glycoside hydrolase family 71 protein n=1 Tax=Gymnopus androsaceus JB14 TaxID=1447944 RepID=A0A6A4HSY1_9AGAR|nr:glycoside hydrolase family 71 protein [Gymnopus androsaceus JB14]